MKKIIILCFLILIICLFLFGLGCGKIEIAVPNYFESPMHKYAREHEKKILDSQKVQFISACNAADSIFNIAIEDGILKESEQRQVFSLLDSADNLASKINTFKKWSSLDKVDKDEVKLSESSHLLYILLYKNLNGIDFGVPNLQEQFNKQEKGLNSEAAHVFVEPVSSEMENQIHSFIASVTNGREGFIFLLIILLIWVVALIK